MMRSVEDPLYRGPAGQASTQATPRKHPSYNDSSPLASLQNQVDTWAGSTAKPHPKTPPPSLWQRFWQWFLHLIGQLGRFGYRQLQQVQSSLTGGKHIP